MQNKSVKGIGENLLNIKKNKKKLSYLFEFKINLRCINLMVKRVYHIFQEF